MKTIKIAIMLFIAVNCVTSFTETKAQSVSVNFSMFQNQLSPYGRWINNPRYGQVWIYRDANFRPYYTDGHWEYTNYGWSWVSDYDWGWAPFHYGRWEYDNFYGWMWIPDYTWGPAWVSWSSYDNYYGWAPLGYGYGINTSFNSLPYNYWTFVPRANLCDRDIHHYYVSSDRNNNFRNAVIINNYYNNTITRGPERKEVERFTHNPIRERRIDDRERTQWVNRTTTNTQNSTIERTQRQNHVNDNYRNERVNEPNHPQGNLPQRQSPMERRIEPQRNQQQTQPAPQTQNIPQRQSPMERRIEPQRNQRQTQTAPQSQNVPQRQSPMERRIEPQRNVERNYMPSNNRPANNGNLQRGNQIPMRRS